MMRATTPEAQHMPESPKDPIETMAVFGLWPGRDDAPREAPVAQLRTQWVAARIALEEFQAEAATV
jgi:hypothetical protein